MTKKYGIIGAVLVLAMIFLINSPSVENPKGEWWSLQNRIEDFMKDISKYDEEDADVVDKYTALNDEYKELELLYSEYELKYSDYLDENMKNKKEELDKYYAKVMGFEYKDEENSWDDGVANSDTSSSTSSSSSDYSDESSSASNSNSSSDGSSSSSTNNSSSSSGSHSHDNVSTNKHIGKSVYIANGNSYYHAISNCKYLEGASTSVVTLTSSMSKYECNCWTNPVVYKPPTSTGGSSSSGSSSSGGRIVYIASGNSYYHSSSSCKFLNGASVTAVGINNVGGKHACNCVKY